MSRYLVIGETSLARRVCATLDAAPAVVTHLERPGDEELRQALRTRVDAVAVLVRQDVVALRYALAVAHLDRDVRLVVTVFDRTVAEQLRLLLPQATVTSLADLAAPSLAGPCLDAGWLAARPAGDLVDVIRAGPDGPLFERTAVRRPRWWVRLALRAVPRLRPHDAGTLLMLGGLGGVLAILLLDWCSLVLAGGRSPVDAYFEAARVVTTVGPASAEEHAAGYLVFAATAMLVTVGLSAALTAGIVDRLLGARMLAVLGARSAPRAGHVIVVGLGQVGIRLCVELRRMGVPVVGVERNGSAPHLRLARSLRIATVVGHGEDRKLLQDLGLHRARALAAVGSDELDNIAVAVAAYGVSPGTRVVLRAGEQEAIAETRSLLPLGVTRDVTRISALHVVACLRGHPADGAVADDSRLYTHHAQELTAGTVGDRQDCTHTTMFPVL